MIDTGSDYSGIGAFDEALDDQGIKQRKRFACDLDKYARKSYIYNRGTPNDRKILKTDECKFVDDIFYRKYINTKLKEPTEEELNEATRIAKELAHKFSFYYPWNVYDREIPKDPLGIYMTSPPCQAFSMAGKRGGESDKRGILFYNSHEFIQKNKPRYFIFENVKGLLSDDNGRTFQKWCDMLGGKSVNGNPVLFPHEDSVPYHIYYKVLNSKEYGVPQNRERIFIIGIRDDEDNTFLWPKPQHLTKKLGDVLEEYVPLKYYLSKEMLNKISNWNSNQNPLDKLFTQDDIMSTVLARGDGETHAGMKLIKVGFVNQDTQASAIYDDNGLSPTISAGSQGYAIGYVKVNSATKKGYEIAKVGDSINLTHPNSDTRRGRVGKDMAQTLDTACNQAVLIEGEWVQLTEVRTEEAKEERRKNMAKGKDYSSRRGKKLVERKDKIANTLTAAQGREQLLTNGYAIRKLTPRECLRLMNFGDDFQIVVSDTQAYKQAGNSIVVAVLKNLTSKLNFK